jgi:hypothetical protein
MQSTPVVVETIYRKTNISHLKKGIWLYFYLLIFEGALRKWVLPGLAQPLLVVRDPIAVWLIYVAMRDGVWKPNTKVTAMWGVTILAFITALLVGHGNIIVAIYGMRITLLHFPLIFIIGTIFNRQDVLNVGKMMLWLNIAMTLLVAAQFYSPQSAWVNRGIGGDAEGSGFTGAEGFFRVPGTFSFSNGLSLFYGFSAAFIFYFWLARKESVIHISKNLLIGSTVALLAAIPLSISRTVLFEVVTSLIFMLFISGKNPKIVKQIAVGAVSITLLLFILNTFTFFQTATSAFTTRFTTADKVEGGAGGTFGRFLSGFIGAFYDGKATYFGFGLGMGTNAGSQLMTGKIQFNVSEGEWGRLIGEMGFTLGLIMILIRVGFVFGVTVNAWRSISWGNMLPWMLMSFAFLPIMNGQWAQPTALGFCILSGGLVLAAMKKK